MQDKRESSGMEPGPSPKPDDAGTGEDEERSGEETGTEHTETGTTMLRLVGDIPPELWNRFGTRVLPKLRAGEDLTVRIDSSVLVNAGSFKNLSRELRQALDDLGLGDQLEIQRE